MIVAALLSLIKNIIYSAGRVYIIILVGCMIGRLEVSKKIFCKETFIGIFKSNLLSVRIMQGFLLFFIVLETLNNTSADVRKVSEIRAEQSNESIEDNYYREQDEISEMLSLVWKSDHDGTITIYSTDYSIDEIYNEEIHNYTFSKGKDGVFFLTDEEGAKWDIKFYTDEGDRCIVLSHNTDKFVYWYIDDIYNCDNGGNINAGDQVRQENMERI